MKSKAMTGKIFSDKKNIIYAVLGLIVIIFVLLYARSCTKLIHAPEQGDKRAVLYNEDPISEENKILVSGASASNSTDPERKGFVPFLRLDGVNLDNYYRQNRADFGETAPSVSGILTYKGDSLRSSSTYGNADINKGTFSSKWKVEIEESIALTKDLDYVGQPLVITWSGTEKKLLSLKEDADDKDELTEVIYASTDGNIYFIDIEDGSQSRVPINLGCPVTGTGTICPDGTPLYVVGAGDCSKGDTSEIYVVDLISNTVIFSFGDRSNFAMELPDQRFNFSASAIFSEANDCLITQGENGVIYSYSVNARLGSAQLSTTFSQKAEYTYSVSDGNGGTELAEFSSSPAAWGSYIYTADINGNLVCTDVNEWNTVWVRNLGASSDATPCLEIDKEDGTAYIYIGSSLNLDDGKRTEGSIYLYKLNAANGDIIWRREYNAHVTKKTNGGAVASACLGTEGLGDYVYFVIAGSDSRKSGKIVCLDKEDGGEHYSVALKHYSVSDPVAAYGKDGKGYVIISDNRGNLFMLDGESGECLDILKLKERLTSNPIVYDDMLVVATDEGVYGIELK